MSKTAIVTGASRGIGRAIATRLARDGFAVVVNFASNQERAEEAVAGIQTSGGTAIAVKADIANPADVERLFAETASRFESIDVVVNNSGIMPLSPIAKSDVELFDNDWISDAGRRTRQQASAGSTANRGGPRAVRSDWVRRPLPG